MKELLLKIKELGTEEEHQNLAQEMKKLPDYELSKILGNLRVIANILKLESKNRGYYDF
jgi:hypothetical protein